MIIDLSVPVDNDMPVYPGDPEVKIKQAGVLKKDGFSDHVLTIGTHVGTHIDAPAHMIESGKTLNMIPVNRFVGRGRYIRVENNTFSVDTLKNADIRPGDIVLFHTGMAEVFDQPHVYFEEFPAIPEEVAQYLIDQNVAMVGIDMCSPDHPDFPIHKKLLRNDILIIENLANLDQLAGKNFKVTALPINLKIDGAPARVIAEVE